MRQSEYIQTPFTTLQISEKNVGNSKKPFHSLLNGLCCLAIYPKPC